MRPAKTAPADQRVWQIGLLLLIVLLLLGGVAYLFLRPQGKRSQLKSLLEPLPQHPLIKVYMNQQQANSFVDLRGIDRYGDDHEGLILDFVNSAQQTLDVAVQEFRLPRVAKAVIAKHRSGVKVRVIIENTYSKGWSEFTEAEASRLDSHRRPRYEEYKIFADENKDGVLTTEEARRNDAVYLMKQAGIPLIDDTADGSRGPGLMHHKYVVVDGQKVLLTSTNFTWSDAYGDYDNLETRGNANNMMIINSPEVANLFLEEFNIMWGDGPGGKLDSKFAVKKPHRPVRKVQVGDAEVWVKFSPDSKSRVPWQESTNGVIATNLGKARKSIDMALFVFAEPRIGNLLEEKQKQGVQIAALVDPSFAYREYATTLDMWGYVSTQDCRVGNRRPWSKPIPGKVGIPDLVKGDKLHHKYGLVDDELVITGSHNWSASANHLNDETLVVVKHPTVAAHYRREFDRLFENARLGPSRKIVETGQKVCAPNGSRKRVVRRRPPSDDNNLEQE
ncbi:MAG: phospholipase D-like domain-containing protein [Pseudanabaenaceae cyanobacterium SKYGB_i_bin29]|nr:phospholipase D-like domain-containing protein [Pseudanabaenaceae cyanobacterium SKYG29]MDW8422569.1 phospholipase D-like domain-containing protein [Pseudanabaenaceae cyanobacterium SKYGB_i_bin29]